MKTDADSCLRPSYEVLTHQKQKENMHIFLSRLLMFRKKPFCLEASRFQFTVRDISEFSDFFFFNKTPPECVETLQKDKQYLWIRELQGEKNITITHWRLSQSLFFFYLLCWYSQTRLSKVKRLRWWVLKSKRHASNTFTPTNKDRNEASFGPELE